MEFIIYGLGAVGGFYGSLIANATLQNPKLGKVYFIAKDKLIKSFRKSPIMTLDFIKREKFLCKYQINTEQLEIKTSYKDLSIHSNNNVNTKVILLCVKSKDTEAALNDILTVADENTYIISVQNGVLNEERIITNIQARNSRAKLIACLTNIAIETKAPGHWIQRIHPGNPYKIIIGSYTHPKLSQKIEEIFISLKNMNINILKSENIKKDLWTKLVWNSAFNPISVLYNATISELYASKDIQIEILGIMHETVTIAKAQNIILNESIAEHHFQYTSDPDWASFKTSMLQDYQAGKEIELDDLLGFIIDQGKLLSIATPFASKIYNEIKNKLNI